MALGLARNIAGWRQRCWWLCAKDREAGNSVLSPLLCGDQLRELWKKHLSKTRRNQKTQRESQTQSWELQDTGWVLHAVDISSVNQANIGRCEQVRIFATLKARITDLLFPKAFVCLWSLQNKSEMTFLAVLWKWGDFFFTKFNMFTDKLLYTNDHGNFCRPVP